MIGAFLADLTVGHAIGVVSGFVCGLVLTRAVLAAPRGYQDASGFHYARRAGDRTSGVIALWSDDEPDPDVIDLCQLAELDAHRINTHHRGA